MKGSVLCIFALVAISCPSISHALKESFETESMTPWSPFRGLSFLQTDSSVACVHGVMSGGECLCEGGGKWVGASCNECSLTCRNGRLNDQDCRCEECPEQFSDDDECGRCTKKLRCEHSGTWNPDSCKCDCEPGPWTGDTCNECKWSVTSGTAQLCQNGGEFISAACRCSCKGNFSGDTCQKCNINCLYGGQPDMEKCECICPQAKWQPWMNNCRDTSCDKKCENGGELASDGTCQCLCKGGYGGEECSVCSRTCNNGVALVDCTCSCDEPWTGPDCNICNLRCEHGTLKQSNGVCKCVCTPPYEGEECDQCPKSFFETTGVIDCKHHGSVAYDGCSCNCADHWGGPTCERCDLDCGPGIVDAVNCKCRCPNSWAGNRCEFCPLTSGSCQNGGRFDASTCSCMCPPGLGGSHCQDCEIDCCNNGKSIVTNSGCMCQCPMNWGGNRCQSCNPICQNGGQRDDATCTCVCPAPWIGDLCEVCQILPNHCGSAAHDSDACACAAKKGTKTTLVHPGCSMNGVHNGSGGCTCNGGSCGSNCQDTCMTETHPEVINRAADKVPFTHADLATPASESLPPTPIVNPGVACSGPSCNLSEQEKHDRQVVSGGCVNGRKGSNGNCACTGQWSGADCTTCAMTCNNGVLQSSNGTCACQCNPGYGGLQCETRSS